MCLFDYSCDIAAELAALDWRKVNVPQILLAEMGADEATGAIDDMNAETTIAHHLLAEAEWAANATPEQYWKALGRAV